MDAYIVINILILFFIVLMPAIGGSYFSGKYPDSQLSKWLARLGFKESDPTNNTLYLALCFIPLAFITIFRSPENGLSTDYGTYLENANYIHGNGLASIADNSIIQVESGLALLMYLGGFFSNGTLIPFLFITTVIVLACYAYRFKRDSPIVWLSVFSLVTIGSYYVVFNVIAQATAVAITFLAAGYIYNRERSFRNFLKYTVIILLAALVHKTALLMIPMYFILTYRFHNARSGLLLKVVLLIGLVLTALFFDDIFNWSVQVIFPEYQVSVDAGASWLGAGSIIAISRPLFILMFVYINRKYVDFKNKMDLVSVNATFIFLLINVLSLQTHLLQRFSYYFIPLSLMIIPLAIARMPKGLAQRWTIGIVALFMIFSVASSYIGGDMTFKYIWQE